MFAPPFEAAARTAWVSDECLSLTTATWVPDFVCKSSWFIDMSVVSVEWHMPGGLYDMYSWDNVK